MFRVFGIPLELHLTFLVVPALVAWAGWEHRGAGLGGAVLNTLFVLLFFVCVVLHELGHCLVAQRDKILIHRILVLPIGGVAQFEGIPRDPRKELLMTAAGPAVNFVIAGVILLFTGWPADVEAGLPPLERYAQIPFAVGVANLVMGIFNLLPVFPMDGGRLLRAALSLKFPYLKATRAAVYVAKPIAAGLALLAFFHQLWLVGVLFVFIYAAGDMEYKFTAQLERLRGRTAADAMRRFYPRLGPENTVADAILLARDHPNEEVFVMDGGRLCGVATRETLKANAAADKNATPLGEIALNRPVGLRAAAPLDEIANDLGRSPYTLIPVFEDGALVGVLHTKLIHEALFWEALARKHEIVANGGQPTT